MFLPETQNGQKTVTGKCQKSIKRTFPSPKVSAHQRSKECPSQSPIVSAFTFFSMREARLPAELFFFSCVQRSDLFWQTLMCQKVSSGSVSASFIRAVSRSLSSLAAVCGDGVRERSHSLRSSVCAPHAFCFSISYSLSLSHLSLSSFLPCDSFLGLFMCIFSSFSHRSSLHMSLSLSFSSVFLTRSSAFCLSLFLSPNV